MNPKPCSWCVPKPDLAFIADSNGFFSDFDCDQSYGLGVCGGCGGLGIQTHEEDFKARASRIMKLRFEYCPTGEKLPDPPNCVRLIALKNLKREVTEHYQLYAKGRVCYAKFLLDTELDRLILMYENVIAAEHAFYQDTQSSPDVEHHDQFRHALIAAILGNLDEAETIYRSFMETSTNSITWHDAGTFFLLYRRDTEQALTCYRKSCEYEPRKSLHSLQTIRLLHLLDRPDEVNSFLRKATECEDFGELDPETRQQILQILSRS